MELPPTVKECLTWAAVKQTTSSSQQWVGAWPWPQEAPIVKCIFSAAKDFYGRYLEGCWPTGHAFELLICLHAFAVPQLCPTTTPITVISGSCWNICVMYPKARIFYLWLIDLANREKLYKPRVSLDTTFKREWNQELPLPLPQAVSHHIITCVLSVLTRLTTFLALVIQLRSSLVIGLAKHLQDKLNPHCWMTSKEKNGSAGAMLFWSAGVKTSKFCVVVLLILHEALFCSMLSDILNNVILP